MSDFDQVGSGPSAWKDENGVNVVSCLDSLEEDGFLPIVTSSPT